MHTNENILDDILDEAMNAGGTLFGGAGGGGSGNFSYAQQSGVKTWAHGSPKSRSSTSDPQGYNVKDIGDDEHLFAHQAAKKRPFPLENIFDYFADAYLQLCNAEVQLKSCNKYNSLIADNREKKALLQHLNRKTKALKVMIKNMTEDLDRLSFS